MKHLYLNLKRFDIPPEWGGVNRLAPVSKWASTILKETQEALQTYDLRQVEFAMFFPEVHLLEALSARTKNSPVKIGCQSVYREDTAFYQESAAHGKEGTPQQNKSGGGNFGAFTANRPAAAMAAIGCDSVLIGHCEERKDKMELLTAAGVTAQAASAAVNQALNKEIRCATARGLTVLYCIGEKSEEQEQWQEVLGSQLAVGLQGIDTSKVVIAYEPVWSIGPGKTPADKDYITKIARFAKEKTAGLDIVYGGGLKQDNAAMLASIPEIDGGLIALTRFQGEIGFYPEEYLEIVALYLQNLK